MTGCDRAQDALPHEAYLTALASLENVGPATFRWLLSHGSPKRVWHRVGSGKLSPGPGARIGRSQIEQWMSQSQLLDPSSLWRRCEELGIGVVSLGSPGYPDELADDIDPPVVLFQHGGPDRLVQPRVAIVGTRRATGYGIQTALNLGRELASAGITVVSGLALGIDAAGHQGALEALSVDSGEDLHRTGEPRSQSQSFAVWSDDRRGLSESNSLPIPGPLAVVGSSLESPCPRRNLPLARMVATHGLIYSEVPPGTTSAPWRFPVRNRIIAAMSDVVVVVESAADGGSMHTVREALDRDRVVMAVPGPIGSRSSEGTNQLLRDGAAPCLGVEDVLLELGIGSSHSANCERAGRQGAGPSSSESEKRPRPTGVAAVVLDSLGWRPATLESIAAACGLTPRELAKAAASLEAEGWIARTGSWVERRNEGSKNTGGEHRGSG